MMDDLSELKSRVVAAQERLQQSAEQERRYGLRLNDIVAIVEGSLAKQRDELETLRRNLEQSQANLESASSELDQTRRELDRTRSRLDEEIERMRSDNAALTRNHEAAKAGLIEAQGALTSLQGKLSHRETQNEQLRRMLLDLLSVIESNDRPSLQDAMRRLEDGFQKLIEIEKDSTQTPVIASMAQSPSAPAPEEMIEAEIAEELAEEPAADSFTPSDETPGDDADEIAAQLTNMPQDAVGEELSEIVEEFEAQAAAQLTGERQPAATEGDDTSSEPEPLEQIAMSEAGDIVQEPGTEIRDSDQAGNAETSKTTNAGKNQEELVNALLDAERRLIEAEAYSAANANSPVAEIIRRISMRTRELSDAAHS